MRQWDFSNTVRTGLWEGAIKFDQASFVWFLILLECSLVTTLCFVSALQQSGSVYTYMCSFPYSPLRFIAGF